MVVTRAALQAFFLQIAILYRPCVSRHGTLQGTLIILEGLESMPCCESRLGIFSRTIRVVLYSLFRSVPTVMLDTLSLVMHAFRFIEPTRASVDVFLNVHHG